MGRHHQKARHQRRVEGAKPIWAGIFARYRRHEDLPPPPWGSLVAPIPLNALSRVRKDRYERLYENHPIRKQGFPVRPGVHPERRRGREHAGFVPAMAIQTLQTAKRDCRLIFLCPGGAGRVGFPEELRSNGLRGWANPRRNLGTGGNYGKRGNKENQEGRIGRRRWNCRLRSRVGFVLGPMMEENLRRALQVSHGDPSVFVTQPLSLAFIVATVLILIGIVTTAVRKRRGIITG